MAAAGSGGHSRPTVTRKASGARNPNNSAGAVARALRSYGERRRTRAMLQGAVRASPKLVGYKDHAVRPILHGQHCSSGPLLRLGHYPQAQRTSARQCARGAERLHHQHFAPSAHPFVRPSLADRFVARLPSRRAVDAVRNWSASFCRRCPAGPMEYADHRRPDTFRFTREHVFRRAADDRDILRRQLSWRRHFDRSARHLYDSFDTGHHRRRDVLGELRPRTSRSQE